MNGRSSQQPEAAPLLATGNAAEYGGVTGISVRSNSFDGSNCKADGPFSIRHLSSRFGDFIAQHTGTSLLALLLRSGVFVLSFVRTNTRIRKHQR
jgi:hypothetical protein